MAGQETSQVAVEQMQHVVDSLQKHPKVVVVGGLERNHLDPNQIPNPSLAVDWGNSRTLEIFTYPIQPMYDADQLNDFMSGLVPDLEPNGTDKFESGNVLLKDERMGEYVGRGLRLGRLQYRELIGSVAVTADVSLKEGFTAGEAASGWQATERRDLYQQTIVRVFPSAPHLLDAAIGINENAIPQDELGKLVGGVDERHEAVAPGYSERRINRLFRVPILGGSVETPAQVQ